MMLLKFFLGTNPDLVSSTRLTKQLVSVRRPFPQQTNPARRPQNFPNLFPVSSVLYV